MGFEFRPASSPSLAGLSPAPPVAVAAVRGEGQGCGTQGYAPLRLGRHGSYLLSEPVSPAQFFANLPDCFGVRRFLLIIYIIIGHSCQAGENIHNIVYGKY